MSGGSFSFLIGRWCGGEWDAGLKSRGLDMKFSLFYFLEGRLYNGRGYVCSFSGGVAVCILISSITSIIVIIIFIHQMTPFTGFCYGEARFSD